MLKEIPKGATFTLRLIEPQKSGFGSIGPRSDIKKGKKSAGYGSGKETLRFKADGSAQIEKVVSISSQLQGKDCNFKNNVRVPSIFMIFFFFYTEQKANFHENAFSY